MDKKTKKTNEKKLVVTSGVIRQSAQKVRLVVGLVKGVRVPGEARQILAMVSKRASLIVEKLIKQAVADAVNNRKLEEHTLILRGFEVNEGPTMKRHRFGGRGRVKPVLKRTCRVTVTLESNSLKKENK